MVCVFWRFHFADVLLCEKIMGRNGTEYIETTSKGRHHTGIPIYHTAGL